MFLKTSSTVSKITISQITSSILGIVVMMTIFPSLSKAQGTVSTSNKNTELANEKKVITALTTAPIVVGPILSKPKPKPFGYGFTGSFGVVTSGMFPAYNRKYYGADNNNTVGWGTLPETNQKVRKEVKYGDIDSDFERDLFLGLSGFFIYKPTPYIALFLNGGLSIVNFSFNTSSDVSTYYYGRPSKKSSDSKDKNEQTDNISDYTDKLDFRKDVKKSDRYSYKFIEVFLDINARWYPIWVPNVYLFLGPSLIYNVYKNCKVSGKNTKSNAKKINIAFTWGIGYDFGTVFLDIFTSVYLLDTFSYLQYDSSVPNFRRDNISKILGARIGVDISKFI